MTCICITHNNERYHHPQCTELHTVKAVGYVGGTPETPHLFRGMWPRGTCVHEFSKKPNEQRQYLCTNCHQPMCSDCGSEIVWWYSSKGYCKRDQSHNGYATSVKIELDPDIILTVCNGNQDKAKMVIQALESNDIKRVIELLKPKPFEGPRNSRMK